MNIWTVKAPPPPPYLPPQPALQPPELATWGGLLGSHDTSHPIITMEDTDSEDEEGLGASHLLPPEGEHGPFNSLPLPDPRLLRAGTGGRGDGARRRVLRRPLPGGGAGPQRRALLRDAPRQYGGHGDVVTVPGAVYPTVLSLVSPPFSPWWCRATTPSPAS